MANVGGDRLDLPDPSHGLEKHGGVGTAHADAHGISGARQALDEMAAEKAGAAEDGDMALFRAGRDL